MILVSQHQINIGTILQVIVIKATLHQPIILGSIYILPHDPINEIKLNKLIEQIPKPTHYKVTITVTTLYGVARKPIKKAKIFNNNNLCLLDNKSQAYLNPFTGSNSAIDITLCDPSSYWDYKWKIYNDLYCNDHFPIILKIHHLFMMIDSPFGN